MKRQRGVAVVTAILIVAVAASAATMMLSQQSAMLDQTGMVVARAQADAYAQAGIDWARGVLTANGRASNGVDSLDQPWAQPIAALPVERAVVSGFLVDEQGKFDLNAMAAGGNVARDAHDIFAVLLQRLQLNPDLADAVQDWVDEDGDARPTGAESPYYLALPRPYRAADRPMVQVEELYRVRGFDAVTVAKLRPYVTALPPPQNRSTVSAVNVNTASALVLSAVLDVPLEKVAPFIAARRVKAFAAKEPALELLRRTGSANVHDAFLDVKSSFFGTRILVAQDDVRLATDALLQRAGDSSVAVVWRRPRY